MSNNPVLLYAGEYESLKETKTLHRKKFVSSSNQPSLLSDTGKRKDEAGRRI